MLLWRSILFVPPQIERYVARAARAGADAVALDLEDGVALRDKAAARAAVPLAAAMLASQGIDVLVRLNHDSTSQNRDLTHCAGVGIAGFILPKVENIEQIRHLENSLRTQQVRQAMLLPMIETPRMLLGLAGLPDLGPHVVGLALGDEDLSAAIGCNPRSETLQLARQMLVLTASAQQLPSFALISSNFRDLQHYRTACERARALGLSGGFCIHPAQVPILNEAFSPTIAEVATAERVLAASHDDGAVSVDGQMVDRPVALRAAALLERARAINERVRSKRCDRD